MPLVHALLAASLLLPLPRSGGAAAPAASRTYIVRQVNGRDLPFQDRFSTTPGYEHRARMEQAAVRLNGNGTFTMTIYGAYRDAPRDMPGFAGQPRDEEVKGRWAQQGSAVTLRFAPAKNGRAVAPATGQLTGDRLLLRYTIGWDYGIRSGSRSYQLTAVYDPSFL